MTNEKKTAIWTFVAAMTCGILIYCCYAATMTGIYELGVR